MDAVLLARLQFAMTIGFHFLFPPISIGLAWLLVFIEGMGWRKNDETWVRMGKFFGRLFALTFAVGVATGIVMEFQFGTNWASYSRFVGDIFGAPLAAEGVFAFFLESGFLGLYLFGRGRVGKGVHWFSILMVAVGATISAFWILVANSWQQTPAGFEVVNGRAVLTSFSDAVFNPSMWVRFFHTFTAALITGAFFVGGVSAWRLLRGNRDEIALRGLKLAAAAGFVFAVMSAFPTGDNHARQVAKTQPEKFAAIEGIYRTQRGAPLVAFGIPLSDPPRLAAAVEIPKLASWLAFGDPDAEVKGIDAFGPGDIPPLQLTFVSFHSMVMLGMLFMGVMALGLLLWWFKKVDRARWYHWIVVVVSPLTLAASQLGWITAEVGRQPWSVYHLLRTSNSVSVTVGVPELWFSIALIGLVYVLLGGLYIFMLVREVNRGPEKAGEVA
jgi:cytochrome d ubiquinol oxidase subunit I